MNINQCRTRRINLTKKVARPRLDKSQLDGVDKGAEINSGADVIISNVLPFLGKVCKEDYCVAD
jgi:hypothetical protein